MRKALWPLESIVKGLQGKKRSGFKTCICSEYEAEAAF